ncbi:azurin [Salinimicrobium flavum]|uniref:Azurin n=1 Tax=Salinimicrobium flavum TaxID=1737065 RepID=A0ABW5J197_9FLAO
MRNVSKWLAVFATMAFISCGDEKKEKETITIGEDNTLEQVETTESTTMTDNAVSEGEAVISRDGVTEVRLTGNDQMKFNLKEIRVKAGDKVKLTLTHVGQLPENAMGHNFVLLKQGTDIPEFANKAMEAKDNEYIPQNSEQVIVNTEMIGGGEETSIEFDAPAAGTYDFICSFPGHYVQMQGKFIVE